AFNTSSFSDEDEIIFETNSGLKLILNYITLQEYPYPSKEISYELKVTSVGKSTYEYGEILILSDGPDKFYETDVGTVVFQKTGNNSIVDDAIVYFYSVYSDNEISAADMAKLDINLIIDDITIRSYQKN
ncbi:MAG: hypothetical protein JW817_04870, partial [Clostridiales bacterium]|nr:hypothetical protein [Clostridiales bacterium]